MKKLLLFLVLVGLLALALGGTVGAQPPTVSDPPGPVAGSSPVLVSAAWAARADVVSPTVSAVDPGSAANDLGTPVTITGTGFALDVATGTIPRRSPWAARR